MGWVYAILFAAWLMMVIYVLLEIRKIYEKGETLPINVVVACSLKRMSGVDTSKLVTTGIYRYSRNPQNLGLFLVFLGISIAGRSLLALLLTEVFVIGFHMYAIKLEESYLERIFGEEYRRYKERSPRYFGMPKRR